MLIVGERINCTRKRVGAAAQARDAERIKAEAVRQVKAGAHILDVNGGIAGQEEEVLPWLVGVVQDAVDVPLCLDSPSPEALRRALPLCKRRPMINSLTAEPDRIEGILPLVKEHNARIVALCLGAAGPPQDSADRVAIAGQLIETLTGAGVALGDVFVDPCLFPISTGSDQGKDVLTALEAVTSRYPGVHTICGLSNISYGLPRRGLLNEAFLVAAMAHGMDSAIMDPCDARLMALLLSAETVLGKDEFCAAYLKAFRDGRLDLAAQGGGAGA